MKKILYLLLLSICIDVSAFAEVQMDFSSPQKTLETYLSSAKSLSFEKTDQCYTLEFLVFTQTNNEYMRHRNTSQLTNSYASMANESYSIEMYGDKAIIRFAPEFKRPQPLYMIKEVGDWKIDAMFMFDNVIMVDGDPEIDWKWKNALIDNEAAWIKS